MQLLLPGTDDYERARVVFNVGAQGRPAAIARCASVEDVQQAVRWGVAEGKSIAVRAGGHSINGAGSATGALVIDLRPLDGIRVGDALSVGGGVCWGDVFTRIEPLAKVTPSGFDPRVGVAGLTLGGGYGLLSRSHGLSCDNLIAAEVVLASGERVEADDELLWALRGAGAGFGVVTRLDLRLHPRPPLVAGQIEYPLDRVREVLRATRDVAAGFPDAATVYVGIDTLGTVELQAFHVGDHAGARRWLAPLPHFGGALRSDFREARYTPVAHPGTFPEGHHHAWRADFVRGLDDGVIDVLAEHTLRLRGQRLWVAIEHLGGAVARVPADATAFPHRAAGWGLVSASHWADAPPTALLEAQEALQRALAPWSIGRYVNYTGPDEADAAYGANLPRLRALKQRLDPTDRFCHNVRIT